MDRYKSGNQELANRTMIVVMRFSWVGGIRVDEALLNGPFDGLKGISMEMIAFIRAFGYVKHRAQDKAQVRDKHRQAGKVLSRNHRVLRIITMLFMNRKPRHFGVILM